MKYLSEDHYKLFKKIFTNDYLFSIVDILDESEDWKPAQVTDNGNAYMTMPTIRRQKIIEKEDTSSPEILKLLERIQTETFKKAKDENLPVHELSVEVCQLIRADQSDFFAQHADSKNDLPRCYSLLIAFNDDFIGGEIELHFEEGNDPCIYHLEAGSALGYNPLIRSQHHKVLRKVSFMGLCILSRNKESHKRYLESIKEKDNTKD